MKAKLIIEGKEIEIEISEEEYKKLHPSENGYERVAEENTYFYVSARSCVGVDVDNYCHVDDGLYESANYYSSEPVAENNARADKLMRQLRRFSVEHRECWVNLNDINTKKFFVTYNYENNEIQPGYTLQVKAFGTICFDSREATQAAIDKFHDELIWYFTEYKDSL